jgi:hypothetical protein
VGCDLVRSGGEAYGGVPFNRWGPQLAQPPGSQPVREVPDDHCFPLGALAAIQPVFSDAERLALAGFLAGYRGLTREAYALDLRQFATWCRTRSLALFSVRRADIESFARELEACGGARATVTRRLCTIAGFYKYAGTEPSPSPARAARSSRSRWRRGPPGQSTWPSASAPAVPCS